MVPRRIDYYFVKAGELHTGVTFLVVPKNTSEEEITKLIMEKGIHVVGIKHTEEEKA